MEPIHAFCFNGNLEKVKRCLRKFPFKVSFLDGIYQRNCFIFASLKGHVPVVRFLMEFENNEINQTDSFGFSALHYACSNGHFKVVKEILKHPNVQIDLNDNPKKVTPLMLACQNSDVESVRILLKNYANPHLMDSEESSCLNMTHTEDVRIVLSNFRNGLFQIWKDEKTGGGAGFDTTKKILLEHLDGKYVSALIIEQIIYLYGDDCKEKDAEFFSKLIAIQLKKKKIGHWSTLFKTLRGRIDFVERISYLLVELYLENAAAHEKFGSKMLEKVKAFRFLAHDVEYPIDFIGKVLGIESKSLILYALKEFHALMLIEFDAKNEVVKIDEIRLRVLEKIVKEDEKEQIKKDIVESMFGIILNEENVTDFEKSFELFGDTIKSNEKVLEFCRDVINVEFVEKLKVDERKEVNSRVSTSTIDTTNDAMQEEKENKKDGNSEEEKRENDISEETENEENSDDIPKALLQNIRIKYQETSFNADWKRALVVSNTNCGNFPKIYQAQKDGEKIGKLIQMFGFKTLVLNEGISQIQFMESLFEILEERKKFVEENPNGKTMLFVFYCGYFINGNFSLDDFDKKKGFNGVDLKYVFSQIDESHCGKNATNVVFLHVREINRVKKYFMGSSQFLVMDTDMDERMVHSIHGRRTMNSSYCLCLTSLFQDYLHEDIEKIPKMMRCDFPNTLHYSTLTDTIVRFMKSDEEDEDEEEIEIFIDFSKPITVKKCDKEDVLKTLRDEEVEEIMKGDDHDGNENKIEEKNAEETGV